MRSSMRKGYKLHASVHAVMEGHVQVVELLLQQGADPDAESELNCSPRSLAAQKGNKAMAALFGQRRKR